MDIEALKSLRSSVGWEEVKRGIDDLVSLEINKLKITTPEGVVRIQERIRSLEQMKHLPDDLIEREE